MSAIAANASLVSVKKISAGAGNADTNAHAAIVAIKTVNNLTTPPSNLSAAKSGTEDANFAWKTNSLTKNQILQRASTAILAQANASRQNVLSLLPGQA